MPRSASIPVDESAGSGGWPPQFEDRPFDDSENGEELQGEPGELLHRKPQLPYSEDAEQAVLSAMLMVAEAVDQARALVDAQMFFRVGHQQHFTAMLALADRGVAIDPLTLSHELENSNALESSGGKDYIGYLVDAVPTAANVQHHAKIIREKAYERHLLELGVRVSQARYLGTPAGEIATWQMKELSGAMVRYGDRAQRRIRLISDVELETLQAAPDLVEGRVPARVLSQIFGPSGSGKTFAALDLVGCISTGIPWHGHRVSPGPTVYVVGEGILGMKRRLAAWKELNGIVGSIPIHFLAMGVPVAADSPQLRELLREIAKLPEPPVAIVLDTVSRNFPGGSQSDDEAMNRFVEGCVLLKEETESTVIAVHHTGWTELERSRGSSAWPAALDTEIRCDRDGGRLTLTWTKQRDDEAPVPMALEMTKAGSSLALRAMDHAGGNLDGNRLACLRTIHRLEGGATHGIWMKEAGLDKKRSSFNQTLDWLVAEAYVKHAGKKYEITDAGRLALGPLVHRQSIVSPSSAVSNRSITPGSYKTPGMDQDPNSSGGPGSYLTREEEEEYFAQQASLKLEPAGS